MSSSMSFLASPDGEHVVPVDRLGLLLGEADDRRRSPCRRRRRPASGPACWRPSAGTARRRGRRASPRRGWSRMTRLSARLEVAKARRLGTLALIRPVTTSTLGRWVASTRWMPAALASWVMRTTESSTSRGATIIRSASSSTITSDVGIRHVDPLAAGWRGQLAVADLAVEVVDVAHPAGGEVLVAHVHLAHDPLQGLGGLLRAGDDRGDQVRDAFVRGELDPFRVDEHQPHLVRGGARQDRRDQRVDARGLAGAGGAGDEDVRHLGEVGDDEAALDVLAEADEQRVAVVGRGAALRSTSPRLTARGRCWGSRCPPRSCRGSG